MKALLLSGGMDSAALASWIKPDLAISVDYGQLPAAGEMRAARAIAAHLNISHEVIVTDTRRLGLGTMCQGTQRPSTAPEWWPLRNQLLLTLAVMRLESVGVGDVIIGTVGSDSEHSDGTPEFIESFNLLLKSQRSLVRVLAPAISMSSEQLIRQSGISGELLGWTISCHTSDIGCGECRGCNKHIEVRESLGLMG